ncbi:MAG: DUF4258 domain-containing protein [Dongiaceae bacterium]
MGESRLVFRVHAIRRMFERKISVADVRKAVETGEVIESYPGDTPYPSRLVLGWSGSRPVHVVVADNVAAGETVVITAYRPDPALWNKSFRQRRKS